MFMKNKSKDCVCYLCLATVGKEDTKEERTPDNDETGATEEEPILLKELKMAVQVSDRHDSKCSK